MYMNIYVGNLSYEVTEDELQQLFAEYGSVVNGLIQYLQVSSPGKPVLSRLHPNSCKV